MTKLESNELFYDRDKNIASFFSGGNIIDRLTTYKNRGEVGRMSATMWSQASLLSDQDIETLGKFIEETMNE